MKKSIVILVLTMAALASTVGVFALTVIQTPVNNQNLTADITYNVTANGSEYIDLTWWYGTDNTTFTNLTSRHNSTQMWLANSSGHWQGTMGVADLTDSPYYLKAGGNGTSNSTAVFVGFDDTVPRIMTIEGNATRTRATKSINFLIHATDGVTNTDGFTDGVANCTLHIETEGYVQATDGGTNTFYYNLTAAGGGNKWFRVSCTDYHSQSSAYTNYFTYSIGGGTSEDAYVISPQQPQAIVPAPSMVKIGERAVDKRIIGLLALAAIAFWLFKKK